MAEVRSKRYEKTCLPENINYDQVPSLSNEARHVLKNARPATIGIASRLPGMTPAAVSLLLVYVKKLQGIAAV